MEPVYDTDKVGKSQTRYHGWGELITIILLKKRRN